MEDIMKLLSHSDNTSLDSFESSDSDGSLDSSVYISQEISQNKISKKEEKRDRQPTRRPDPNVYNRNALLARENRRKKKAHLETMEKELEDLRNINSQLKKALKRQTKAVKRLEQEKGYFKSMVANRTEILELLTALNSRMPSQRQERGSKSPSESLSSSACTVSRNNSCYDAPQANFENSSDNDFEPSTFDETWTDLLNEDFNEFQKSELETSDQNTYCVNNEHSYVTNMGDVIAEELLQKRSQDQVGVCLHVSRGKVCLEFCPSCHWNACGMPPMQLLQNEADIENFKTSI